MRNPGLPKSLTYIVPDPDRHESVTSFREIARLCSYTYLVVLSVNILGSAGDITLTWSSPILHKLLSNDTSENPFKKPITHHEESWIGSLLNIGAIVGPLPYSILSDRIGRKITILLIAMPMIVSFLMMAVVRHVYLYYAGRLLAGIGLGGGTTIIPMYIAEIAEDSNRGMLSVSLNVFWTFGNLLPYLMGPFLSVFWFNIILAAIPIISCVMIVLIGVESPYYLLNKDKVPEAKAVILKLRGCTERAANHEIAHMKSSLSQSTNEAGKFIDLFKTKAARKALLFSVVLMFFQQLSGINAILFYTELIFEVSGSSLRPAISSIVIGVFFFMSSLITPFFADDLGRRFFLLISAFGTMSAHAVLGIYFYYLDVVERNMSDLSWVPMTSLILFIACYNIGLGPIPWTVSSELFPIPLKSIGASMTSFTCWLTSFLVTRFFDDLTMSLGKAGTFWLFSSFCCCAALFIFFALPETRGKSFKEIQDILEK